MHRPSPRILSLSLAVLSALFLAAAAAAARGGEKPPEDAKPKTAYQKFMEKGRLREFPARPWKQAFTHNSICYRVRTNTSKEVAEYVGVLMDAVHLHYCKLFGVEGTRKANINVFRTHKEMAAWAKKHCKYTVNTSTIGFFSTKYGGSICAVWQRIRGQHPEVVLMHEGTHQFVSAVWGSRTLPIWLNEGFAVYFENSRFDGRNLDVGRIPVSRLRRLQGQMRTGKHVKLETLFATDRKKFSVDCYGSSWAFVFWLANSAKGPRKQIHQLALQRFIADCRRNRRDGKRLAAYLGLKMEDLERQWKEWVLKLDPKDPYGGTRKKELGKDPGGKRAK